VAQSATTCVSSNDLARNHPGEIIRAVTIVPAHWSPEQALAVFELLDDLREQIWHHYQLHLLELLHEQRLPPEDCAILSLPFEDPPF